MLMMDLQVISVFIYELFFEIVAEVICFVVMEKLACFALFRDLFLVAYAILIC